MINKIRRFYHNLLWCWRNRWLLKHLWHYRPYDPEYSIDLFCEALEKVAYNLKEDMWHVNARNRYRRCLYASKKLKQLYELGSFLGYEDKTVDYITANTQSYWKKLSNGYVEFKSERSPVLDKMAGVAYKRLKKRYENEVGDIWKFIGKHMQTWWS